MKPSAIQEALVLELSVFELFLKRQRSNHGRTKYFQRMSMAFKAFQRHGIPELVSCLDSLDNQIDDLEKKKKTKQSRDEHWESSSESPVERLHREIRKSLSAFPEVLSRLQHAASALFTEVGRGFFLPLCTVALGLVARCRTLLMRLGLALITDELPKLQDRYRTVTGSSLEELSNETNRDLMALFVETDPNLDAKEFRDQSLKRRRMKTKQKQPHETEKTQSDTQTEESKPEHTAETEGSGPQSSKTNVDDDVGEGVHSQVATRGEGEARYLGLFGADLQADLVQEVKAKKKLAKTKGSAKKRSKKKDKKTKSKRPKLDKPKKDFFDELFD